MEIVTGALPSVLEKLGDLLVGQYNLQKGVDGEIRFLQVELESMKGALEDMSKTPTDQLHNNDKIWARDVRELSYDMEDSIDTFMVRGQGSTEPTRPYGFMEFIRRSCDLLSQFHVRRKIATEIRDMKRRIIEVRDRRLRYEVNLGVDKPVIVDPRLFARFTEVKELVGIDEARDELINKIMIEENEVPVKQGKIVSIVGFGGLGKTTLADAVYKKIRARFHCCAFISVSQTPDLKKLYKDLLYDLGQSNNEEILDERRLIEKLREFLQDKRYFVVVDDVWDIQVWNKIRCALPDNDVGYTIITTTRICDVAEKAGGAYKMEPYKMEPLSLNNSRKLLYRRIFGNQTKNNNQEIEKCPDEELVEVSDKILKKCAGVPLAIITMASLLACKARNKIEWYEVCNSIGTGLENNMDVENMRKILSFSYYEMPCHLRTCLLYLSMFPEDFRIYKEQLIRMWVAEGFIQCKQPGMSLFELGESYFNDLINRSMIQPEYDRFDDIIYFCRIHDMVLDLIRSLSSEENFITVLNNMDQTSPANTVRRLSLQNGKESYAVAQTTRCLEHARSVVVFKSAIAQVPAPGSCRVLRVLELRGCNLSQANSLNGLGNLYHLRYLGLCFTGISHLPEEVGNLQFLQTLDVWNSNISSLPSSVVQLRNLMYLKIANSTRVPNGIGNLTCLEQLSGLSIDGSTANIVEELGQLTELRLLHTDLNEWNDKLLESLGKLQKIQELDISLHDDDEDEDERRRNIGGLDAWVAPRHLRVLKTIHICWFSTIPGWVNPSLLPHVTNLSIAVRELHQADLEILGSLLDLRYLNLEVDNKSLGIHQAFAVVAGSFPCLVFCYLHEFVWPVVFEQGAMPRLRRLVLWSVYVRKERGIACGDGGVHIGLGNLPSLEELDVTLESENACREEAEQAKAALWNEVEMHPNHPSHSLRNV